MQAGLRKILFVVLAAVIMIAALGLGQVSPARARTQYNPLISNSLFLYSPTVLDFDTQAFLDGRASPLKDHVEQIDGQPWTAAGSIEYNAMYYGINPQVILVLLQAQGSLDAQPPASGFYDNVKRLAETAAVPFYARRDGRDDGQVIFSSHEILKVPQTLNAGTYAVQVALAQILPLDEWLRWTSGAAPLFKTAFTASFGEPLNDPDAAIQPARASTLPSNFVLPFTVGTKWYYTSGPHNYSGGKVGCTSGSACPRPWSSIDLAPPESIACPGGAYPASRWIVAAQGGKVITSKQALVVIDHENGWRTYYSHVSTADRRPTGSVKQNDRLGHPSCEVEPGGSSSGIHLHFGIWKSGEGFVNIAGSRLSGWLIGETTHYNGIMTLDGKKRTAEIGRQDGVNDILNGGPAGFNSQFTSNASGWSAVNGNWAVSTSGYYHSGGQLGNFSSVKHINSYPTLTYTVRMKGTGCSNCGNYIYFRGNPTPMFPSDSRWVQGYVFEYSNNGYYIIGMQLNGAFYIWRDWTYSPAITDTWNTLKVTANGGFMQFFINGTRVAYGNPAGISNGQVGIGFYRDYYAVNHLYVDWATLTTTAPKSATSTEGILFNESDLTLAPGGTLPRTSP